MIKLKNKFAIGCLAQWYEIEIFEEYIESVIKSLSEIENKKNVIVDVVVNLAQNLEEIDRKQLELGEIFQRYLTIRRKLSENRVNTKFNFYPSSIEQAVRNKEIKPYTIADYRREFNEKYCEQVDVLMWGESDSLIPKQTFQILDNLHENTKQSNSKYVAFFSICKMWDDSWKPLEHPEFTDKPFYDSPEEFKPEHWWSLRYTMSLDEMNSFNDKVDELDVKVLNHHKFNGCGLVISSDVIKSGVNIPKSVFFVHEDTAFMIMLQRVLGMIPQYVIKNILLVHNRNHPKKRMYVKGETGKTVNLKRRSNDWYVKANKMCEHNTYNLFTQEKIYTWEDVFDES